MYSIKTLSVLAFAATAFAAPTPSEKKGVFARGWEDWSNSGNGWRGGNRFWNRPSPSAEVTVDGYGGDAQPAVETATAVTYVYTTVDAPSTPEVTAPPSNNNNAGGWGQPQSSAAPAPTTEASSDNSNNGWGSQPASSAAAPQPSGNTGSISSGGDWFDVANKWRSAGGLAPFTQDSTLVGNAQKTADDSVGGLKHELNPGTMGQVLAPGDSSDFESVYVGGWLCELPDLPGLNGICSTAAQGWNHDGQTGHAEILTGDYKKIGCALGSSTGVWACDFA